MKPELLLFMSACALHVFFFSQHFLITRVSKDLKSCLKVLICVVVVVGDALGPQCHAEQPDQGVFSHPHRSTQAPERP